MTISIIIPSLNDNIALEQLLSNIRTWNQEVQEIIVVDAAADKNCQSICQKHQAQWLSFTKNRGAQQKFGAAHASSDVLWFLHADALPHINSIPYIHSQIEAGAKGGFFRFEFNTEHLSLTQKILTFFTNWRSRHFSAYGDQGIFVERKFYADSEGHTDQALFEEVRLIKALRKSGHLSISNLPIKVATRRWDRDGYWKRTLHNRFLTVAYMFGVSVEQLSEWYKPKQKTEKI